MTASYNLEIDPAKLSEAVSLFKFVGGNTNEALRLAINKTTPKVRTEASSRIRQQVRLTASYVRENLTIKKATRSSLDGRLTTPSRGIMLSRFSTDTQITSDKVAWFKAPLTPKAGIFVKIKTSGARKKVEGKHGGSVFYTLLNNRKTVAIAERIPGSRKIDVLHGPSLSQVFNTVRADVMPMAREEYQAQVLDAMRYIVRKQNPPAEVVE